jgi:UTP-glucose-1-phosphate uridylyltransferase
MRFPRIASEAALRLNRPPMKPTLVVMAAGMGSRYGGLKQIDPMGPSGETILDYSVFDALRAGFGKVVFIIRPDFEEAFRTGVSAKFAGKIAVDYAFQTLDTLPAGFSVPEGREKPWGTTHAILCAREVVKEPFAVINADDFYGRTSFAVLHDYLKALPNDSAEYSMVGFTLKNTLSEHGTVTRGVCKTDANGFLTEIEEMTKIGSSANGVSNTKEDGTVVPLSGLEPVSMNMWGFSPHLFDQLEVLFTEFLTQHGKELKGECYIPLSVGELVRRRQATCKVLPTDSTWFGVTYREDKPIVQASIAALTSSGAYPPALWS